MKRSGFTLIEIMIVVAIVTLLATVAIPNFIKYRNRTMISVCAANLDQIARAFESYMMEQNLKYTSDTGYTAAQLSSALVEGTNYLKAWPTCAAGGTYSLTVEAATQAPTAYCAISGHL